MVFRSVIGFEKDPPEDIVTCAVAPFDALTGRIVQRNVTASVTVAGETAESETLKLPDKPIRNLSGLLVFINLPDHPKYRIAVKARAAGYFDPEPADFTPPERKDKNALDLKDSLRIDFPLFPRPDFAFSEEVTLVSGVVVRGTEGVDGARILATVPAPNAGMGNNHPDHSFETRSDERGAFALALRLPAFFENEESGDAEDRADKGVSVKFRIETRGGDDEWQLDLEWDIKIIESRRHVFSSPIDLDIPDHSTVLTS